MTRVRIATVATLLAAGLAAAATPGARAEELIKARFLISFADPDSGFVLHQLVQSRRTWPSVERCRIEAEGAAERNLAAARDLKLFTPARRAAQVSIAFQSCQSIR